MKQLLRFAFVILLFVLGLCVSASAQQPIIYGRNGYSSGYQIIAAIDGGFWVGGQCYDAKGILRYWVVRGSKQGKIIWDSLYGTSARDFLWSIRPSKDGGVLIGGFTQDTLNANIQTAEMFRLDSLGRVEKRYEVDYRHADHCHWFQERPQGGYYWAGHTDSRGDPLGDMILQKLDSGMNKIWEKTYGTPASEHAHCGALYHDGGCGLLGHTSINNFEHFYAVRVDSNGGLLWSKTFQSSPVMFDSPYGIVATKEGGFAYFGGSQDLQGTVGSMWLVVIDSNGSKIFDHHYGGSVSFAYSGLQKPDGGFVLVGYSDSASHGGVDMMAVSTDAKGNVIWQKTFGSKMDDYGYAGFQHGSQFVLVGDTQNTPDSLTQMMIVVVDSNGNEVGYAQPSGVSRNSLIAANNAMNLSPNPARASGEIEISLIHGDLIERLEVVDILGHVIYASGAHASSVHWDTKSATGIAPPAGVYFVRAFTKDGLIEGKLVLQ